MAATVYTLTLAAALLMAVLLSLALKPRFIRVLISVCILAASVTGLILYGVGYGGAAGSPAGITIAVLRTFFSTAGMFAGQNGYDNLVKAAPWIAENVPFQLVFWIAHMAAMYSTASALLTTLGKGLLQRLRRLLLPFSRVVVVFGCNENSRRFAADAAEAASVRIVFVDELPSESIRQALTPLSAVFWPRSRITADGGWLRKLGLRSRNRKRLEIACFCPGDGEAKNALYDVLAALKRQAIPAVRVHFSVVCDSEFNFNFLAEGTDCGQDHWFADIFTRGELSARRLIEKAPPYRTLQFRSDGTADGDFSALVIGFGEVGQSVLRHLIRNGQFTGSRFSATVADRCHEGCGGVFRQQYAGMLSEYHVSFETMDAFSRQFAQWLPAHAKDLRTAVVCTGSEKDNREIADSIRVLREAQPGLFAPQMILACCDKERITLCDCAADEKTGGLRSPFFCGEAGTVRKDLVFPALTSAELLSGAPDRMAFAVNSTYLLASRGQAQSRDLRAAFEQSWNSCDAMSRMSSRASAAFIPALLAAAGISLPDYSDALFAERIADRDRLDVLSQTEHLRWCAFEYSMGVSPMPAGEFRRRAARACAEFEPYRAALTAALDTLDTARKAGGAKPADRDALTAAEAALRDAKAHLSRTVRKEIPVFGVGGIHICLTGWEELKLLWEPWRPCYLAEQFLRDAADRIGAARDGRPAPPVSTAAEPGDTYFQELDTANIKAIPDVLRIAEENAGSGGDAER